MSKEFVINERILLTDDAVECLIAIRDNRGIANRASKRGREIQDMKGYHELSGHKLITRSGGFSEGSFLEDSLTDKGYKILVQVDIQQFKVKE